MKQLFASADTFLRESDWRDLALVKPYSACFP